METILIYTLKSAIILAIFYTIYRVFLERETFFSTNRHFLIAGILAAITLPALVFTQFVYLDPLPTDTLRIDESMLIKASNALENESFNWWQWGFYIYLTGFFIMSCRFLAQIFSIMKFLLGKPVVKSSGYRFIQSNDLETPFSFFKYIVYNPQNHSEDELEMILAHEKTHATQLHTLDILLAQIILMLQWFNPVAWLYKKKIEQNLEFLADKEALSETANRKNYQLTLLKVSFAGNSPALANNFYQSFIKKRIVMLNKKESHRTGKLKIAAVLPLIAIFLWSFNVKKEIVIKGNDNLKFAGPVKQAVSNDVENSANLFGKKSTVVIGGNITENPSSKTTVPSNPAVTPTNTPQFNSTVQQSDPFKVIIKETMTRDEIDGVVEKLKSDYDVVLRVSNLKYNSANLISGVTLKIKDNVTGNTGNFNLKKESNQSDEEGVGLIVIERTASGGLQFGSGKTMTEYLDKTQNLSDKINQMHVRSDSLHARARDSQAAIEERKKALEDRQKELRDRVEKRQEEIAQRAIEHEQRRVEQISEERQEEINARAKAYEKDKMRLVEDVKLRKEEMDAKMQEAKERQKEMRNIVVSEDKFNNSPLRLTDDILFILDGKVTDAATVNKLDPLNIDKMEVYRANKIPKKYKDKAEGKKGVIEIVTKEK